MSKHGTHRYKPNINIKRLKGKWQDNNNKHAHTTTTKNSTPIQAHTAQHTTGNIHTPKQNMATYYTNFMSPRSPLTPKTTRQTSFTDPTHQHFQQYQLTHYCNKTDTHWYQQLHVQLQDPTSHREQTT
jgi:hypothetical protein